MYLSKLQVLNWAQMINIWQYFQKYSNFKGKHLISIFEKEIGQSGGTLTVILQANSCTIGGNDVHGRGYQRKAL